MSRRRIRRGQSRPQDHVVTGIAWYSADQWDLLRNTADDPEELEDTYEEWLKTAEWTLNLIRSRGYDVRNVPVDVEQLIRWCRDSGRALDGAARADFAGMKMREEEQEG